MDSLDWTHDDGPHPRIPVQGEILSVGGDALTRDHLVRLVAGNDCFSAINDCFSLANDNFTTEQSIKVSLKNYRMGCLSGIASKF